MKEKKQRDFKLEILFPILIALYETSAYLSNDMYLPALPSIKEYLSISVEQAQNTITVWFVGTALFQCIIGPLSDRFGRRPVLFLGALIFIIGNLLSALAENIYIFNIGRFFQGLMVPTCIITLYAILHEYFSTQKAIRILAWMGSIIIIGPAVGPFFGSLILMKYDWHVIFYILIVCSLIPAVALYFIMPESKNIGKHNPMIISEIVSKYKKLFSTKSFMLYSLIFSISIFPPIAWIVSGPFLAIDKYGLSPIDFGFIQLKIFGAYAFSCLIVNKFSEKYEPHKILSFGQFICIASGFMSVLLNLIRPDSLDVVIVSLIFISIGNAFVLAVSNRLAIESSSMAKGFVVSGFSMIISLSTIFISKFVIEVFDFEVQEFCYLILFTTLISFILYRCSKYQS